MKNPIYMILVAGTLLSACKNKTLVDAASDKRKLDSVQEASAKQRIIDSVKLANTNNAPETQTSSTAEAPKKKGWSNTAKGAVIGAGVGAVTGAIVDKKHGEGAIVGGLIGAGVGAGTGAIIDHNKKKKKKRKTS